jgi:hypothetical protein
MQLGYKTRLVAAFVVAGVALATVWNHATATEPQGAEEASIGASLADVTKPTAIDKGNGALKSVAKKRGVAAHEQVSPELIQKWFTEVGLIFQKDDQGRFIIPFRDEASGIAFKVVLILRAKGASTWAIQSLVPIQVPLPAGSEGLLKGLLFANTWNTNQFYVKSSLVVPQGATPFYLLDSAMPVEDGISKSEFFNNFLKIVVMSSNTYAGKAAQLGASQPH